MTLRLDQIPAALLRAPRTTDAYVEWVGKTIDALANEKNKVPTSVTAVFTALEKFYQSLPKSKISKEDLLYPSLTSRLDSLYMAADNAERQCKKESFNKAAVIATCAKVNNQQKAMQYFLKNSPGLQSQSETIRSKLQVCYKHLKPSRWSIALQRISQAQTFARGICKNIPCSSRVIHLIPTIASAIWRNRPRTPRAIKLVATGALLGASASKWAGFNLNSYPTYLAAAIGAYAIYRLFNRRSPQIVDKTVQGTLFEKNKLKDLKASQETQAASLLGSFFYYNFDSEMTSERIDAAQKQTESGTTIELANATEMPRSQGAFLTFLTDLQSEVTDENPLGVVITNKDKSAISIGLDKKGKFPIAVFDPKTSSCFYFGRLKDAANKAYELTKGSTCLFRKGKCDPRDDITQDSIPRAERIKIGSQVQAVGGHLFYNFVQENRLHQGTTKHLYTHAEICELFTKACTYFANARTKTPISIKDLLRVFYNDNVRIGDDEEEALKFFAGFYAVDAGPMRDQLFREKRDRLQRFKDLVTPSKRFNEEDMRGWLEGLGDRLDPLDAQAIRLAQQDQPFDGQDFDMVDPANLFNQLFPPLPPVHRLPRLPRVPGPGFRFDPPQPRPFDHANAEQFFQRIMGWDEDIDMHFNI